MRLAHWTALIGALLLALLLVAHISVLDRQRGVAQSYGQLVATFEHIDKRWRLQLVPQATIRAQLREQGYLDEYQARRATQIAVQLADLGQQRGRAASRLAVAWQQVGAPPPRWMD